MGQASSAKKNPIENAKNLNEYCHSVISEIKNDIRRNGTPSRQKIEEITENYYNEINMVNPNIANILCEKLSIQEESNDALFDFYQKKLNLIDKAYAMMRSLKAEIEKTDPMDEFAIKKYEKNLNLLAKFVDVLTFEDMMTEEQIEKYGEKIFSITEKNILSFEE